MNRRTFLKLSTAATVSLAIPMLTLSDKLDDGCVVYWNMKSNFSGTTFPLGTIQCPVSNPIDARKIANSMGINRIQELSS